MELIFYPGKAAKSISFKVKVEMKHLDLYKLQFKLIVQDYQKVLLSQIPAFAALRGKETLSDSHFREAQVFLIALFSHRILLFQA